MCFFNEKTAYESRMVDWIADVCSSDLRRLGDVAVAGLQGARELRRRIAGHQRGLEKRQFLQIDVLADLRAVVGDEARQRLGLQPDPAEGMPLGKGDERIEADLLQRRGKEQRRVATGGRLGRRPGRERGCTDVEESVVA